MKIKFNNNNILLMSILPKQNIKIYIELSIEIFDKTNIYSVVLKRINDSYIVVKKNYRTKEDAMKNFLFHQENILNKSIR